MGILSQHTCRAKHHVMNPKDIQFHLLVVTSVKLENSFSHFKYISNETMRTIIKRSCVTYTLCLWCYCQSLLLSFRWNVSWCGSYIHRWDWSHTFLQLQPPPPHPFQRWTHTHWVWPLESGKLSSLQWIFKLVFSVTFRRMTFSKVRDWKMDLYSFGWTNLWDPFSWALGDTLSQIMGGSARAWAGSYPTSQGPLPRERVKDWGDLGGTLRWLKLSKEGHIWMVKI